MNILAIIGLIFVGVIMIVGAVLIFSNIRGGKKFPFLLYSGDGKSVNTIYAKVKTDPQNRTNKKFFFKELDMPLDIRQPTLFINGKGYREITFNDLSEYAYLEHNGIKREDLSDEEKKLLSNKGSIKQGEYIKGLKFNTVLYKQKSLIPEEKQLALFRYKEASIEYQNPMNKWQAYVMVGMFVMVLIIGLGVIYSTYAYVKFGSNIVDIDKQNQKTAEITNKNIEALERIAEQQTVIIQAINDNTEIKRQIS